MLITALAENARTASRLREAAADALEAIEKLGFSYPFSSLTVVQAQTGRADGALGSALVAVDADAKADELLAQMTRLCARQIFGVKPGDTLLILGDEETGIIVTKPDVLRDAADDIFGKMEK